MGAWAVDSSGNWSGTNNWTGGSVPSGISSTAIFSNNITGDRFVTNDAKRTVGNLVFGDGDPSSAGSWTLTGSAALPLTLAVSNGTPAIAVGTLGGGKTVTIGTTLAGTQGLALKLCRHIDF